MTFWSYVADNLESISRYTSIGVATAGAVVLTLVLFRWTWIEKIYREFVAKVAVAFFRALAAAAAIMSRASPSVSGGPLDQPWALTIVISVVGYLLWEVTGAYGDHLYKLAKEKNAAEYNEEIETLTQDRDDAESEAKKLNWLLTHLRELVSQKVQRVRKVAGQAAGSRASINQAREGLAPEEQIRIILESLASFFRMDVVSQGGNIGQNFRVGLFVEKDGRLQPLDAFDLSTKRHKPFTTPDSHIERFRLDNASNPSHAVRCVVEGRMLVVSDCANEPTFEYFEEKQRSYLRSMVACPLNECYPDGINRAKAALLIDTDVTGYFQEDDKEMIESQIREFVVRIDLEYAIRGLTT
jgi:hypothetical protein